MVDIVAFFKFSSTEKGLGGGKGATWTKKLFYDDLIVLKQQPGKHKIGPELYNKSFSHAWGHMAAEALTRKQRDILQDFVFPLANLLLCFFGVFFSPMSTHGKLEMATPKENMKRKMKSTIAQEIMPSSISRSVRLKNTKDCGIFPFWRPIWVKPERHEAAYEGHRQGGHSTCGNVKSTSPKPFIRGLTIIPFFAFSGKTVTKYMTNET